MKDNQLMVSLLRKLYADNFTTYYKSHGFHFNVQGTMFSQDHGLLEEIYQFLWDQHDTIGEQIRQLDKAVLPSLADILDLTNIVECKKGKESSKEMFNELQQDFDTIMEVGQVIFEKSNSYGGLNTLIGDYLKGLSKLNWKVKATLGRSIV
jgi:starvation-inducible DNA-binding protein